MSYNYNKDASPHQYTNQVMYQNQPISIGQPVVITHQPPSYIGAAAAMPEKDWNSGLCGCCEDVSSCLCVWCFGPCYMCCCISPRMGEHCCTPVCIGLIDPSMALTAMLYRTKMRARYNIRGSAIGDCCCAVCCSPLVVCQLKRELDHLEAAIGAPPFHQN